MTFRSRFFALYVALALLGVLILLALAGCGRSPAPTQAGLFTAEPATRQADPSPTQAGTGQQEAGQDGPASTQTAAGQGGATPTATASATPQPTQTVRPTATPRPTRTQRPTATPEPPEGPEFPSDVNPLTGLEVSDPEVLERCPLAIKVSNSPEVVRPQAGLHQADLVFEHYAEGGVTRLTAVFLGETPEMVGSVRSGRLIDLEIPAMYDAMFAYSGSSAGVGQTYRASDLWPDQIAGPGTSGFYRRNLNKSLEHTLFVDPVRLWEEAERRGMSERKDLRGMSFDAKPPARGRPAESVRVNYRAGISQVEWRYDADGGRYYRWQGGAAHREELSGAQLSSANVIVVSANHVETGILEDTWGGGHWSIEVQIWGEGPVSIFRDGKRYDGIWRRNDRHDMLSFWTQDGSKRIPLKPGNSWFQMVPLGFTELEVTP
jgi:hypothetical protein